MEFQKNQFIRKNPTKIAGNKVFPQQNPFELSKAFIHKKANEKVTMQPITPERRFEEQRNQKHFLNKDLFLK